MDVGEGRQLLSNWAMELRMHRQRAADSARKISAIQKIVAGLLEMFPELAGEFDLETEFKADGVPRGAEAVRIVLQESPNEWFYVSALVDELRARGWLPESENPANAVRAALERLIATPGSDVKKGRDGMQNKVAYSYRPDDAPPDPEPPRYDEEPF
jgi:hypothetical protein